MVFLADSGGRKSRALLVDRFFDLEARYAASGGELPEKRFHEYTSSADRYGTIYRASPSCGEEEKEKSEKELDNKIKEKEKLVVDLEEKIKAMENSRSWRITKPLRYFNGKLRK